MVSASLANVLPLLSSGGLRSDALAQAFQNARKSADLNSQNPHLKLGLDDYTCPEYSFQLCLASGAGVGKGRTIAGLILENWRCGRKRHLWISIGSDLRVDARRDLNDANGEGIEIHALNKLQYGQLDSDKVGSFLHARESCQVGIPPRIAELGCTHGS